MSDSQQYPTIILAGADPAWMFDMQQHLRTVVGWDYDLLLTFSVSQAMRYVTERQVCLLITEATFMRRAEGSGADLARRVREHAANIQVLMIHDGVVPMSPDITYALERKASSEQTLSILSSIFAAHTHGSSAEFSSLL
ncbi:MAG: hypothetical protein WCF99_13160 [Chloroflexales bacterium]